MDVPFFFFTAEVLGCADALPNPSGAGEPATSTKKTEAVANNLPQYFPKGLLIFTKITNYDLNSYARAVRQSVYPFLQLTIILKLHQLLEIHLTVF